MDPSVDPELSLSKKKKKKKKKKKGFGDTKHVTCG